MKTGLRASDAKPIGVDMTGISASVPAEFKPMVAAFMELLESMEKSKDERFAAQTVVEIEMTVLRAAIPELAGSIDVPPQDYPKALANAIQNFRLAYRETQQ